MKRSRFTAFAIVAFLIVVSARAQETNSYPKSRLEVFEERTGAVLIRGTDEIGVAPGKVGGVMVKCRETRDAGTNQREFGVIVTVVQAEGLEDTTYVDYDELDALVRNLDYVSKVDWSITSLSHFEAGYTTRSGLKVATYSSRRTGMIEAVVLSNRLVRSRSFMTTAQLSQFRVLLDQAKAKIELIQKEK
jgi:hypothetical protein